MFDINILNSASVHFFNKKNYYSVEYFLHSWTLNRVYQTILRNDPFIIFVSIEHLDPK